MGVKETWNGKVGEGREDKRDERETDGWYEESVEEILEEDVVDLC